MQCDERIVNEQNFVASLLVAALHCYSEFPVNFQPIRSMPFRFLYSVSRLSLEIHLYLSKREWIHTWIVILFAFRITVKCGYLIHPSAKLNANNNGHRKLGSAGFLKTESKFTHCIVSKFLSRKLFCAKNGNRILNKLDTIFRKSNPSLLAFRYLQ